MVLRGNITVNNKKAVSNGIDSGSSNDTNSVKNNAEAIKTHREEKQNVIKNNRLQRRNNGENHHSH